MHGLSAPHEGEPPCLFFRPFHLLISARQDRSLGYTELRVSDLAKPSESEQAEFLYESVGKRDVEEPLKLGNGSFKGKLHYIAEFVPAFSVRGIRFDSGPNELERAAGRAKAGSPDSAEGGTVHGGSDDEDNVAIPEGITVDHPEDEGAPGANGELGHRKTKSTDTTVSARTTGSTVAEEKRPEEQGVEMSKEELLKYRAYIVPSVAVYMLTGRIQIGRAHV